MVQEENAPETQKSEISAPVGANVSAQSDGGSTSNSASGASDSRKPPQPSAPQTAQIDALAQRLDEKSNDMRLLGLAATELRDSVEAFQNSQDYPYFVEKLVPIILELLKTTPVSFNSGTPEQKLRLCLLDTLLRLQTNETLKPVASNILDVVMEAIKTDNEDNGVLCMKTVTILHRAYKAQLLYQVRPFLDLVTQMFTNIPKVVNEVFGSDTQPASSTTPAQSQHQATPSSLQSPKPPMSPATPGTEPTRPLQKATQSFKVLAECPIIIVLLYSIHKQLVNESLPQYIPHIMEMLSIQAAPQKKEHEKAQARGTVYTGVAPGIKNRATFGELIVAQVKTVSFLAYTLRAFAQSLKPYHQMIPEYVVRLLQDCPCELTSARKELLVATRHILSTDFRTVFIPKVEVLLNEKVLIGEGLTSHETLRPLAYSTIADLIHHVRAELTSSQIWKTLEVYCQNLQDDELATSFQVMSAKLLSNLVERIMRLQDKQEARQIMVLILNVFVERFASLNRNYSIIIAREQKDCEVEETGEKSRDAMDVDKDEIEVSRQQTEQSTIKLRAESQGPALKDARYIFRNLMNFLKTVMFGLKACNPPPTQEFATEKWQESARGFTFEQIEVFRRLFREGIAGHMFFMSASVSQKSVDVSSSLSNPPSTSNKDEKELMEAFATIFIHLDAASLNEIVETELPYLYESLFKNNGLLHIAQSFLASEATSANFSGLLLKFLSGKLLELGEGDSVKTNILIRLFRLSFMAVNLFPNTNERVIQPFVRDIITKSLEYSTKAKDPVAYFHLLRTLFRSIGGGRFEQLYKEVLPLLQTLLESLNKRLETSRRPQEKDLFVELCLTVPVRLSVLVPHLGHLMRPLVEALNGPQELVSQGLRTLELCVDNLTAAYFGPIIEPVIEEVMQALWKHLKPLPYHHQHSHTTLRVLGKLGGRNRAFAGAPTNLKTLEQEASVLLNFRQVGQRSLSIYPGVKCATDVLKNLHIDSHYKVKAFEYVSTVTKLFFDSSPVPEDLATRIADCRAVVLASTYPEPARHRLPAGKNADFMRRKRENKLFTLVLEAVFESIAVPEIKERATELVKIVSEHCTVIELGEFVVEKRKTLRNFDLEENEGAPKLEARVLLDVVIYALSHYNADIREAGLISIRRIYECSEVMFGKDMIHQFPMMRSLFGKLSHTCFEEEYFRKSGAVLGLKEIIVNLNLSREWLSQRQGEFARTMFFVLKDVPADCPAHVKDDASSILFYVMKECNADLTEEQKASKGFRQLCSLLAYDLGNANETVRKTARDCLALVADATGQSVSDVIKPVAKVFLGPIFGKPLRALPFPMQIGYIDAIRYCLDLPDSFLEFNDELMRLLSEALALVDADDESLISASRGVDYTMAEQLAQLRIVCIELLSLALTASEQVNSQFQTRGKVISVLFKTLYSRSPKVVEVAYSGLQKVLADKSLKIPKDLLQNGLRPILMNLSDHKRLTLANLEGLGRLLKLLTGYFKVEIGQKLLDHLKQWADPSVLHALSMKDLKSQPTVQIMVAIVNVFHLLPARADMYMNDLVTTVGFIESHLRRKQRSPFREPVAKFLNKFPEQTLEYFSSRLGDQYLGRFFQDMLCHEECVDLQLFVREHFDTIASQLDNSDINPTRIMNITHWLRSLSMGCPDFLQSQQTALSSLLNKVPELRLTPAQDSSYLHIAQTFEEIQGLWTDIFESTSNSDCELITNVACTMEDHGRVMSRLAMHIYTTVVSSADVEKRRQFLEKSLDIVTNRNMSSSARTFVARTIINPLLRYEGLKRGTLQGLLQKCSGKGGGRGGVWLDQVHGRIWRSSDVGDIHGTLDPLKVELVDMTTTLIKYAPSLVADARKDIIKFGWSYIKTEDIISKQCAYVLIAQFISAYETLAKIVIQIYAVLLKTHQTESKALVLQALDILAPVLPQRVQSSVWAKWPRKVLVEEGHNVSHVVNVYHFIVRQSDLFFDYRDRFIPFIVSAMPKLSFANNSSGEHQLLAVELAELLVKWEQRARKQGNSVKKDDASMDQAYEIPFTQREACITYLIRFVCLLPQMASENPLGKRILALLQKLLSDDIWPDVMVKFSFFERSLLQNDLNTPQAIAACENALEVILVTLRNRSSEWVLENVHQVDRLLERCIRSDNHDIQVVIGNILNTLFEASNGDETDKFQAITTLLSTAIQEHLSNGKVSAGIRLAAVLCKHRAGAIDPVILSLLMKALSKVCKDHLDGSGDINSTESGELIRKMLDIGSRRISYLGEQRRAFLSLVAQLIEKCRDTAILERIIDMTGQWVFSTEDLFPTVKEKAAILSKMMIFETRGEAALVDRFYKIIVGIYEEPRLLKSELSARMEHAFLVGTRLDNVAVRQKLMRILSLSVDKAAIKRLAYIIIEQNWEYIGESQWLNQGLQMLWDSVNLEPLQYDSKTFKFGSLSDISQAVSDTTMDQDMDIDQIPVSESVGEFTMETLVERQRQFIDECRSTKPEHLLVPLVELQYFSRELVSEIWIEIFPQIYSAVSRKDRGDMIRGLVTLLSKDYHMRQVDARPNVVQTLIAGVAKCEQLPPQLVKYAGITYNSWYQAIEMLEGSQVQPNTDSAKVHESTLDALTELYAGLQDDDMFYGVWRRRAKFSETNSALSYEQCGMWTRAQQMHEAAQIKARSGALPFGDTEYGLWEDHWVLCAEKLQQWDVLTELAKHEGFTDLLLECGWRVADWTTDKEPLEQSVRTVMDVPTPRRQMFETFLCLQGYAQRSETLEHLSKQCDEGIQLALRKWYSLPNDGRLIGAHIPLLHGFQQYVEFMEASQVYTSLSTTTAANLDVKSQELKGVLQAWRERLPNVWEDINIWGDLVTWRQHAFGVINKVYLPLVPQVGAAGSGNQQGGAASNSYAYRGFHEMAWIINRFAHVARKHDMPEVCISQLTKIYTLPNIEIQEAFLKLREQAKCHYQSANEMHTGLDVISNTNLVYFGAPQKAEFFTLKGMFLAKLGAQDEANQAFATAVQIDLHLPKAWAEWGRFNDKRFKDSGGGEANISFASNAISCYLQAAGLYKNSKARKLLGRILWLISLDDTTGAIGQAFETYRGDVPVWYWITYIPQLLTSLAHKEARLARHVLIKIAKSYPQALHFHLRTAREDYNALQRQMSQSRQSQGRSASQSPAVATTQGTPGSAGTPSQGGQSASQAQGGQSASQAQDDQAVSSGLAQPSAPTPASTKPNGPSHPWEYVEEIMGILKTAYPLLALSLETIVDQVYSRFKCPVDEDAYRLIVALLNDGVQYMGRLGFAKEDVGLPASTETNISRFADSVLPRHIRPAFEDDFITQKPNLESYIKKLRKWRDRFEAKLDSRPDRINLEALSPPLSEFHYQKFEDVEVPGQYFELKDNNLHFIKIERFLPVVDVVRGVGFCFRRLTIRGHDGSLHPFAVQYPAARHCRREERVAQLFKMLNGVMQRRIETRRRNLQFTLPVAIPFTAHIRIVQDDPAYVSMHAIYEDFCRQQNQSRDAPLDYTAQKLKAAFDPNLPKPDMAAVKMEILGGIQATLVPPTVMKNYFSRRYNLFADFFLFRKQFAYQYAGLTFMTFLMSINNRYPHKYLINMNSGNIWAAEMLPLLPQTKSPPAFHNGEPVPFRLTPNIQSLMGPTVLEALFAMSIMVIARGLTDPEFDLDQYLCVFVRDELISWYTQQHRSSSIPDTQLRETVRHNVEAIVRRATSLAQVGQGNVPANQTVIDLISQAVNSRHLALADNLWMPYF